MNYNASVNIPNISMCVWYQYGCMHQWAYNFNATANTDDGSCEFHSCGLAYSIMYDFVPVPISDCAEHATCIDTGPSTFTCECNPGYMGLTRFDGRECVKIVEGCMDPTADNYHANANTDDGTCVYLGW